MTEHEYDEIAHYVAENFISPLCFDKRPTKEIYFEYTTTKFDEFIKFLIELQESSKNASEKH